MFQDSVLAHHYLDDIAKLCSGIEIGAAVHNPFHIANKIFVGLYEQFYADQVLDVIANGDTLPFSDNSLSFVLSSHVLEHFPDPIKALKEWWRVLRPGGILFAIVPHKQRTFDKARQRTLLSELISRHVTGVWPTDNGHFSVWVTADLLELARYLQMPVLDIRDIDDKVGNGFTIVFKKTTEDLLLPDFANFTITPIVSLPVTPLGIMKRPMTSPGYPVMLPGKIASVVRRPTTQSSALTVCVLYMHGKDYTDW